MNKLFLILFFLLQLYCKAQIGLNTIVPNPDFELYDTCPLSTSSPGDLEINYCTGWYAPTDSGTSDYFNVCNNSIGSAVGIPSNVLGYQGAYSGNGYCGIIPYAIDFQGRHYREYIQSKLNQQLQAGVQYHLSFFVSLASGSYAISKIGAFFSNVPIHRSDYLPLAAIPQIVNQSGFITDSTNWTKIEGTFTAQGGEQYITIGNFEPTITTDTLNLDPSIYQFGIAGDLCYYYIDGIQFSASNESILPNVFSPNADGVNDLWDFSGLNFSDLTVVVYDRWGIKVFEASKPNDAWDGRTNSGGPCSNGVYFYVIEGKNSDNQKKSLKGFIQLIR